MTGFIIFSCAVLLFPLEHSPIAEDYLIIVYSILLDLLELSIIFYSSSTEMDTFKNLLRKNIIIFSIYGLGHQDASFTPLLLSLLLTKIILQLYNYSLLLLLTFLPSLWALRSSLVSLCLSLSPLQVRQAIF